MEKGNFEMKEKKRADKDYKREFASSYSVNCFLFCLHIICPIFISFFILQVNVLVFRMIELFSVLFPGFSLATVTGINRNRNPENPDIIHSPMGTGINSYIALAVGAHPDCFFLQFLNHICIVKDLFFSAVKIPMFCHFCLYKLIPVFPVFKLGCNGFFKYLPVFAAWTNMPGLKSGSLTQE